MSVPSSAVIHTGARSKKWIAISILFLVIAQISSHLVPLWLRDDLYAGDASQHTWWLYRFADHSLFPNDLAAEFMSMPIYSPVGYQLLFKLTAGWIDPLHLCETLAILLAGFSAYLTAKIGFHIGGLPGAATAVITFALLPIIDLHEGGFPRSFGMPIVLGGMLAIVQRRWWLLGLICLFSSFLYPPVILNIAPVGLIVFLYDLLRSFRQSKPAKPDVQSQSVFSRPTLIGLLLGILAMLNIARVYLKPLPPEIGTFYTYNETRQMPEWSKDGRSAFFRGPTAFYYHGPTSGIGLARNHLIIVLILLGLTLARNYRLVAAEAWVLLFLAVAMWALAHLLLFKLYLPSRYTTYALPAFAIFWVSGIARQVYKDFQHVVTARYYVPVCAAIASVCIPTGAVSINSGFQTYLEGSQWKAPIGYEEALAKIREMPSDTLIAAYPVDANAIPIRARHSVLVNAEVSIAYHRMYYAQMQRRLIATFSMFYAVDWRVVDALADQYGVKVFLVNRSRLRNVDADPYYEPFRTTNKPLIEQGRKQGFVMLSVPRDRIIFQSGDVMLVRVGTGK